MPAEINVIVKDEGKRLSTKTLVYETFTVEENDPVIQKCIEECVKNFGSEPSDIQVKISMEIR